MTLYHVGTVKAVRRLRQRGSADIIFLLMILAYGFVTIISGCNGV